MSNAEQLSKMDRFWQELRFEPWTFEKMSGVYRRVTFVKDGLLGKVAEYYADDYIVWTHEGNRDVQRLLQQWQPRSDVAKHRFLLLDEETDVAPRVRSFRLGLLGWLEIVRYKPGDVVSDRFKDLSFLVVKGLEYAVKGVK